MKLTELAAAAERCAVATFSGMNCDVMVRLANTQDWEVRVSSNAFSYYAVVQFDERTKLDNLEQDIAGMRVQMIENLFRDGGEPKRGYPRGIMKPAVTG